MSKKIKTTGLRPAPPLHGTVPLLSTKMKTECLNVVVLVHPDCALNLDPMKKPGSSFREKIEMKFEHADLVWESDDSESPKDPVQRQSLRHVMALDIVIHRRPLFCLCCLRSDENDDQNASVSHLRKRQSRWTHSAEHNTTLNMWNSSTDLRPIHTNTL